jgi:hypothetical protein
MKRFVEGMDRGQSTLFPEYLDDCIDEDTRRLYPTFSIILSLVKRTAGSGWNVRVGPGQACPWTKGPAVLI